MTTRYLVGDVFDRLAEIPDGSVDLVVTSPPFLALRSYLPADHPDKGKEIGSEATPAEYLDVLLEVTAELRRVLAPHGSIAIELGDTYAGSGGAGGDYDPGGWREGQEKFRVDTESQRTSRERGDVRVGGRDGQATIPAPVELSKPGTKSRMQDGNGWPLAKSRTMIPQLYEVALAYGINPLTGEPSPAGRWRVRNVVTWCRPNPPVGALGDKWRPATSDVVVACVSDKRYWDDLATRTSLTERAHRELVADRITSGSTATAPDAEVLSSGMGNGRQSPAGAPLLDYWVIPPKGYSGAHYAVYPQELVVPLVKAMCPRRVCRVCGEPSRRIVEYARSTDANDSTRIKVPNGEPTAVGRQGRPPEIGWEYDRTTLGWSDCGHNDWRPGLTLDPFAGSGTTLAVAHGHGHDSIGIDLDPRNQQLTQSRMGPLFDLDPLEVPT